MRSAPSFPALTQDRPVLVAPSILAADFGHMAESCRAVLDNGAGGGGADLLHLDIMDGHFVPNLTMGPDMCRALRRALPNAFLDVHLMVEDAGAFVDPFAKAGASGLTFHIERVSGGAVDALAARIRNLGMTVGLAINPPTSVETVLPHLPAVDLLLVMSVNPGFGGQAFMPEVLSKVETVRHHGGSRLRVQMDGGINIQTAAACRDAGCDVLVAGSAVFGAPRQEWGSIVAELAGR